MQAKRWRKGIHGSQSKLEQTFQKISLLTYNHDTYLLFRHNQVHFQKGFIQIISRGRCNQLAPGNIKGGKTKEKLCMTS
jgi:hypothetical protein